MPASLLATKLHFPQARSNLVPRPRLVEILERGLRGPLTLISAPAGSGKTTLMSECCASSADKIPIAWISLDPADNDPFRFLSYLIASIESARPGLTRSAGSLLQSSPPAPLEAIVSSLLGALSTLSSDLVLALDDYHAITNLAIHDFLNSLLAHCPLALHLVILTRADPPLPLARLRVRDQLTEIRAEDLRFTVDEVTAFLSKTMGLSLSAEEIASLETQTEGWAAGLQLAALSMQGQDAEHIRSLVSRFTGGHRYIVDYLVEEVLDSQPEDVQSFLLETSLLDRMQASLCDAVTGRADGQTMLEELEKDNLFLIPLDNERRWYRYHHLFSDLLRGRLTRKQPERVRELQHCATEWCAHQGLMEEAISYSLRAQDFYRAAVLIEEYAPTLSMQGYMATLSAWIACLPEAVIGKRPRLGFAEAWALYFEYKFDETEACLERLERNLSAEDADQFGGEIALWHGIIARRHERLEEAESFLRQSLALLTETESALRGRAWVFLGMVYFEDNANKASKALRQARDTFDAKKHIQGALAARYYLARTQITQGNLPGASSTCQSALELAERVPTWPVASYAHLAMAELLYELGSLDTALEHAKSGLALASSGGHADNLFIASLNAARIQRARGNLEEAESMIERARQLSAPTIPIASTLVTQERIRLFLVQGKPSAAAEYMDRTETHSGTGPILPSATIQLSRARCHLALCQPDQATAQLAGIGERVERAGMSRLQLEALCLEAMILEALNHRVEALRVFKRALTLAEDRGYVRTILDEGLQVLKLLQAVRAEGGGLANYAGQLLAVSHSSLMSPAPKPSSQALIEPLSGRELEVLRLVAAGRSNQQIAEELFLATGTVKKHLNNIFGKMNAQNRTECVARARELQLL